MGRNRNWRSTGSIILWIAVCVAALVAVFLYTRSDTTVGKSPMEITAEFVDSNHISVEGRFVVTGAGEERPLDLGARLSFGNGAEFSIAAGEAGEYILQTYLPLPAGEQVVILLDEKPDGSSAKRWIFQTEDTFRVLGVFPADGATDVPTSSSIEILFSYADMEEDDLLRYITVEPGLQFWTNRYNNTVRLFYQEEYLPALTTIEVTVSGELPRGDGQTLGEDVRFSFTTGPEESWDYRLSSMDARIGENVPPGEEILMQVRLGEELRDKPLTTTVYRYPDSDRYLEALTSYQQELIRQEYVGSNWRDIRDSWQLSPKGLEEVMKFQGQAVQVSDTSYDRYILLPDSLPEGWYMATVEAELPSGGTIACSKLIQISPMAVYLTQSVSLDRENGTSVLAWINDTETGAPAADAEVRLESTNFRAAAQTDDTGVALLEGTIELPDRQDDGNATPAYYNISGMSLPLVEVRHGERVFYDVFGNSQYSYFQQVDYSNQFMSYIFTDRPVYRHTDTVQVWGLLRPREEGIPLPQGLHLANQYEEDSFRVPVELKEDGTFLAEVEIESLRGTGIWLTFQDDAQVRYGYQWLRLEDYVKPEYQTTATVEKPVYTAWSDPEIAIDFTASYFEGTPARDYRATAKLPPDYAYSDYTFEEAPLVTDQDGKARTSIRVEENGERYGNDWAPVPITYGIYSDVELNEPQVQGGSFYYLFRDTMLRLDTEEQNTVTVRANRIDISSITSPEQVLVEENLAGAPVDVEVTADLHKVWYERIPNGERYDAINKTTVTAYETEYRDDVVDTLTAATVNGTYTFTDLPEEPYVTYYLEVTVPDSRGNAVTRQIYYSRRSNYFPTNGEHWFQLRRREAVASSVVAGDVMGQTFTGEETLEMYLVDHGEEYHLSPGDSMLYLLYQDTFLEHEVIGQSQFLLPVREQLIPSFQISGAYFDGKQVYAMNASAMVYDPAERELEVHIRPQQESYDPGDTARVTVEVTGKADGQPVAGAKVIAAVVDEAVFAIEEQTPDFLNKLYQYKYYRPLLKYTSSMSADMDGGGMGGGGPENFIPRVDFQDTVLFQELETDQSGRAHMTISLPDNLTSWRVTALAVTDRLWAGEGTGNFAVSKDFFVVPVLPPRLLEGDDLVITAHSAGRETQPETPVRYRAAIVPTGGVQILSEAQSTYQTAGAAGDFLPIAFHNLPEGGIPSGEYQITVTAQEESDNGDAVALPLSVVKSGIDVTVSRKLPLSEAAGLESTTWPVTLGFYDRRHELSVDILSHLAAQDGVRVDQRMARRFALEQMQALGMDLTRVDSQALRDEFDDLRDDWGYRLFPYSTGSEDLSVRIRYGGLEYYNSTYSRFERDSLDSIRDSTERAAAYLMLSDSNLNPISSQDIDTLAEAIADELDGTLHDFRGKMRLVMALYHCGQTDEAIAQYQALVTPVTEAEMDMEGNSMASIGGDVGDTAAASMAAILLEQAEAEDFARYLLNTPAVDELYVLELMYYLKTHPLPEEEGGLQVGYTTDSGGSDTIDLRGGVAYRTFGREQLAKADFHADGEVWVNALYTAGLDAAMDRDDQTIQVIRTIEAAGGGSLKQGELAKITVRFEVDEMVRLNDQGWHLDIYTDFQIDEYVPTGMRYESMENGWVLASRNDQRLSFVGANGSRELTYYARCVAPGNYVEESAFVRTVSGNIWGASERGTLQIRP